MFKNDFTIKSGTDRQDKPVENSNDTAQSSGSSAKDQHASTWSKPSTDASALQTNQAKLHHTLSEIGKRWVRNREIEDAGEKLLTERDKMDNSKFPVFDHMIKLEVFMQTIGELKETEEVAQNRMEYTSDELRAIIEEDERQKKAERFEQWGRQQEQEDPQMSSQGEWQQEQNEWLMERQNLKNLEHIDQEERLADWLEKQKQLREKELPRRQEEARQREENRQFLKKQQQMREDKNQM